LDAQARLKERVCACPDAACVARVQAEAVEWARSHGTRFMGTERERRDLEAIQAEMDRCLQRLAGNPP
jgi:hypothetical protein